jgi:hypothetical protein
MAKDDLYYDLQAVNTVSKELAKRSDATSGREPSAVERGSRERPDGTIEQYERIEFK